MTLDQARDRIALHIEAGSGYNRHAARLVLAEVQREHGQQAVDPLILDLDLERIFDFRPGTAFEW